MHYSILKAIFYLLSFLLVFSSALTSCSSGQKKPNVIFILVDDLGWTDLSCYGSNFYKTPYIDKLAKQSVLFTNAYSASPVCSPTRASILTGQYPARLRLTDFIPGKDFPDAKLSSPNWQKYLDTTQVTMAEIFKTNGYETGHVGKWHLGKDSIYWPKNQGFDVNIGGWYSGAPIKNAKKGINGYFPPYGNPRLNNGPDHEYLTERLTKEANQFIKSNKNTPFFLNFWLYSVHLPLQAKKEKIDKYEAEVNTDYPQHNAVYAAMIEHTDDAVKRIMSTLKKLNIDDNTIIVFTSDNGGLIGNHKRFKASITSNLPLRSGKGDIYEGGVRVPCLIYYPKKIKPRIEDTPIISPDFLPTLIDIANLTYNEKTDFDGVSISKLMQKNKTIKPRPLYWHYPHYHTEGAIPHSAIRSNNYKLIHDIEKDSLMLFNLKKDIGEKHNLIDEKRALAKDLYLNLQNWKADVYAQNPYINSKHR